jgi:hypothetical protein
MNPGENHDAPLWPFVSGHTAGGEDAVRSLADDDLDLLGALRAEGFVAPLTVEGAINGPLFLAWVEQHLTPALKPDNHFVQAGFNALLK